jgi:hypothetical protein
MDPSERQMIEDVTRMGVRAAILLRGVMLQKVNEETLDWGLKELAAGEMLGRYFGTLVQRPEWVDLLNVLHLVHSLEGQLDFQVREYGLDSLKDDLQEINTSLQAIGERFDLPQLREAV